MARDEILVYLCFCHLCDRQWRVETTTDPDVEGTSCPDCGSGFFDFTWTGGAA